MTLSDKVKYTFIFGAVVDFIIACSWLSIASGIEMPSIVSGYFGRGADYNFAMYICAMFMFGWAVILAWGALAPINRVELLAITALFLFLSIVIEALVYPHVLTGLFFVFGVTKRCILVGLFSYIYFIAVKESGCLKRKNCEQL